jgi:integrase
VEERPVRKPRPDRASHCFLIALLRWSGLRISEATSLTLADLDLNHGHETLTVRASKTPAGRRSIPILPNSNPNSPAGCSNSPATG